MLHKSMHGMVCVCVCVLLSIVYTLDEYSYNVALMGSQPCITALCLGNQGKLYIELSQMLMVVQRASSE